MFGLALLAQQLNQQQECLRKCQELSDWQRSRKKDDIVKVFSGGNYRHGVIMSVDGDLVHVKLYSATRREFDGGLTRLNRSDLKLPDKMLIDNIAFKLTYDARKAAAERLHKFAMSASKQELDDILLSLVDLEHQRYIK